MKKIWVKKRLQVTGPGGREGAAGTWEGRQRVPGAGVQERQAGTR